MNRITKYCCEHCGDPLWTDDEVIYRFIFSLNNDVYIHKSCLKKMSAADLFNYIPLTYMPIESGKMSEVSWEYNPNFNH